MAVADEPAEAEAPLDGAPVPFRNVFKGQWINVRDRPSTSSSVVARVAPGDVVHAAAERRGWLRLASVHGAQLMASLDAASQMWALTAHPLHGALLERVRAS